MTKNWPFPQREEQQSCDRPEQLARLGWQYVECPACGSEGARAFPKPEEQQSCDKQEPVLQDIEQYRMQIAGICTAALGYWKEGDSIHPDYDTLALRDVAKLYAKYDALYKAPQRQPLTDEEIWQMVNDCSFNRDLHADKFARAIEAKHGIKETEK